MITEFQSLKMKNEQRRHAAMAKLLWGFKPSIRIHANTISIAEWVSIATSDFVYGIHDKANNVKIVFDSAIALFTVDGPVQVNIQIPRHTINELINIAIVQALSKGHILVVK